jgi:hypothetical protein
MIQPPLISGGYVAAPDKAWLFEDHEPIVLVPYDLNQSSFGTDSDKIRI